jgi:hypothetical protein
MKLLKLIPLFFLIGCATISQHSETAYKNAVDLKVEADVILSKATTPYTSEGNLKALTEFQINLQKAYEYDKGRVKNKITLEMWDTLINPEGHLLGGIIKEWKEQGELRPVYLKFKRRQIATGFDQLIELEYNKNR